MFVAERKKTLDILRLSDAPNLILVNDPYALTVAVRGLKRQAADLSEREIVSGRN